MAEERRELNAQLITHMCEVSIHMKHSNELQKDYILDRKDIYEKIEAHGKDIVRIDTKQGYMAKTGYAMVLMIVAFFTKGYWMNLAIRLKGG